VGVFLSKKKRENGRHVRHTRMTDRKEATARKERRRDQLSEGVVKKATKSKDSKINVRARGGKPVQEVDDLSRRAARTFSGQKGKGPDRKRPTHGAGGTTPAKSPGES